MGRNAAFGRPRRHDQLRLWWQSTTKQSRTNAMLVVGVGAIVVLLLVAATSHDSGRDTPLANATRPQLTPLSGFNTPSTVVVGDLSAAGAPVTPTDLSLVAPTTTVVALAPSVPAATAATATTTTRTAAPATTAPRSPATTVPTTDVIFTEVPAAATTTTSPTTVSTIPSTTPPPTAPPTTETTATTVPVLPLPLPVALPPLLGPG